MAFKGDINLDAVGDLDEGDAAVHAKFLTVKRHGTFNVAVPCPIAGKRKVERLGLGHSRVVNDPANQRRWDLFAQSWWSARCSHHRKFTGQ
jgi:hypothetical protein